MTELDLAEVARERHAYAEAEGRYARVLDGLRGAESGLALVARRGRAWVLARTGRVAEALADFDAALGLARKLGHAEAEIELLLEKGCALDWHNDPPAAQACVDEASARAAATGAATRLIRASLAAARGRTLFRQGRWSEAAAELEAAVHAAEELGAAGYEPLVIALVLLEVVLPNLGRDAEAAQLAVRAIALTRARGDQLNLASALNNRRNLLIARKDLAAAIDDQRAFMEIGQRLGLQLAEYYAEFNLAELHYQAGDVATATPHAQRAAAFEAAQSTIAPRPAAALLQARLLLFQDLLVEARALLGQVQQSLQEARAQNRAASMLTPSEQVLAEMVDLSTRDATEAEWEALLARSATESLEQEPIEVLEMRARDAHRRGQSEIAKRSFDRALEMAARIPNLLEPRIRRATASA